MTKEYFINQLRDAIAEGSMLDNPGGGVSTIAGIGADKLSYIRGISRMYLPYDAVLDVLEKYAGNTVTTNNLKELNPSIFDSTRGGHSCNCTVLFCILERMGLLDSSIKGGGRRGSPFYVKIKRTQNDNYSENYSFR